MFSNGSGDQGSIPGWVIPKTKKWYLIPPCLTLSIIRYLSRVKWVTPKKGTTPSSTLRCSSQWKGNHQVALDYGRQQQQQQDTYDCDVLGGPYKLWVFQHHTCLPSDPTETIVLAGDPTVKRSSRMRYWTAHTWKHCKLFNDKSSLDLYIKYTLFVISLIHPVQNRTWYL